MIDWENEESTEPPITKHISDDVLEGIRNKKLAIPEFTCHGQSVERAVKLVSSVCLNNFGYFALECITYNLKMLIIFIEQYITLAMELF